MSTETIDHTALSLLAEAGAVRSAHIIGQKGGWGVLVKDGVTKRALAAQRSRQVRIFRKLETLVTYLKRIGIDRFDVDAVNYDAASLKMTRTRPDSAAAMKRAHQAAAYDKWLKAEVQEAIDDPRPGIPHEEVMRHMDEKFARLKKRAKGRVNA